MSNFAALMALSASQTQQSEEQVKNALIERQRKEVEKRKAQEERERKERELEARIRQKHFEDQRREEERQRRQEELRKQKDAERQRREEAQRDALRYGPKKAKADGGSHASSSYPSRDTARRRSSGHDSDGGGTSAAMALTREEKRQRKLESELRRGSSAPRRTAHAGYQKAGRRLPGGAVDHIRTSAGPKSDELEMSVKERLLRAPPDLIKLNQIKRDTRTIDEILQDRAKSAQKKVLSGDAAREFSDWFGKGKAAEKKAASISPSRSATPAHAPSISKSSPNGSASPLGANNKAKSTAVHPTASAPKSTLPSFSKSVTTTSKPVPPAERKGSTGGVTVKSTPVARNNAGTAAVAGKPTPNKPAQLVRQSSSVVSSVKKRPRSSSVSSLSPPPPPKKRPQTELSSEIWKIFGKDRDAYTQQDVLSDDEDMEADAMDLEQEELRSARIARKEEEAALEEERRHEEEKRRKKKEKEMRERGIRA